jgi:transposase
MEAVFNLLYRWIGRALKHCAPASCEVDMLAVVPQMRILIAIEPVDFRFGIDRLSALCREKLEQDPYSGAAFVFRNRRGTSVRILIYDGVGYWLCLRRFSRGRLRWWPQKTQQPLTQLAAQQLQILLYQGLPDGAQLAEDWRKLSLP